MRPGIAFSLALLGMGCTASSTEPEPPDASVVAEVKPTAPPVPAAGLPEAPSPAKAEAPEATSPIEAPSLDDPLPPAPKETAKPKAPVTAPTIGEPVEEPQLYADAYPAVRPKPGARCHEALDALGIHYKVASAAVPGIVDPVLVSSPLRGVRFRHESARRSAPLLVDCRFAIDLARGMDVLHARGVEEFLHVGTYVYRCFGPGTLPDCALSQHGMGMALDFVAFTVGDHTYRVQSDFAVTTPGDTTPTCNATRRNPRDAFLKDVVCTWFESGAFRLILTPNHDQAHRTHIHVDMAEDASHGEPHAAERLAVGVDPGGRAKGD